MVRCRRLWPMSLASRAGWRAKTATPRYQRFRGGDGAALPSQRTWPAAAGNQHWSCRYRVSRTAPVSTLRPTVLEIILASTLPPRLFFARGRSWSMLPPLLQFPAKNQLFSTSSKERSRTRSLRA